MALLATCHGIAGYLPWHCCLNGASTHPASTCRRGTFFTTFYTSNILPLKIFLVAGFSCRLTDSAALVLYNTEYPGTRQEDEDMMLDNALEDNQRMRT
jgi:hypothetical protein